MLTYSILTLHFSECYVRTARRSGTSASPFVVVGRRASKAPKLSGMHRLRTYFHDHHNWLIITTSHVKVVFRHSKTSATILLMLLYMDFIPYSFLLLFQLSFNLGLDALQHPPGTLTWVPPERLGAVRHAAGTCADVQVYFLS